jgi:hypothetical protein
MLNHVEKINESKMICEQSKMTTPRIVMELLQCENNYRKLLLCSRTFSLSAFLERNVDASVATKDGTKQPNSSFDTVNDPSL